MSIDFCQSIRYSNVADNFLPNILGATSRYFTTTFTDRKEDIRANFALLERAVAQFDARFTLRALRSISSLRKRLDQKTLCDVIISAYPAESDTAKTLIQAAGIDSSMVKSMSEQASKLKANGSSTKSSVHDVAPEIDIYLAILIQV